MTFCTKWIFDCFAYMLRLSSYFWSNFAHTILLLFQLCRANERAIVWVSMWSCAVLYVNFGRDLSFSFVFYDHFMVFGGGAEWGPTGKKMHTRWKMAIVHRRKGKNREGKRKDKRLVCNSNKNAQEIVFTQIGMERNRRNKRMAQPVYNRTAVHRYNSFSSAAKSATNHLSASE